MKKVTPPARMRSIAMLLGFVTSSLVCLCVGSILAVRFEGWARLVLASGGFTAYLFFMGQALREFNLPRVFIESRPDPEKQRPRSVASTAPSRPRFEIARPNVHSRRRHAA